MFSSTSDDTQWKASSAEESSKVAEEHSLVFALKETMTTRHHSEAETIFFTNTLGELFPQAMGAQANSEYSALNQPVVSAITEVFKEDLMESNELMFNKVKEQ